MKISDTATMFKPRQYSQFCRTIFFLNFSSKKILVLGNSSVSFTQNFIFDILNRASKFWFWTILQSLWSDLGECLHLTMGNIWQNDNSRTEKGSFFKKRLFLKMQFFINCYWLKLNNPKICQFWHKKSQICLFWTAGNTDIAPLLIPDSSAIHGRKNVIKSIILESLIGTNPPHLPRCLILTRGYRMRWKFHFRRLPCLIFRHLKQCF